MKHPQKVDKKNQISLDLFMIIASAYFLIFLMNMYVHPIMFIIEHGVLNKRQMRSPISFEHVFMVFVLWFLPSTTLVKYIGPVKKKQPNNARIPYRGW